MKHSFLDCTLTTLLLLLLFDGRAQGAPLTFLLP